MSECNINGDNNGDRRHTVAAIAWKITADNNDKDCAEQLSSKYAQIMPPKLESKVLKLPKK